ncbi:choice-of-anchor D domain-containing protein [Longispora urticae]
MRTRTPILSVQAQVAGAVGVFAALAAFAMTTAAGEAPAVAAPVTAPVAAPAVPGAKAAPIVGLAPASHNFGGHQVGTTSPTQTFTVTNTGNAPYAITAVTIGGTNAGDFIKSDDTCTGTSVPGPAGSCTVKVAFKPTTGGPRSGTLTVTDQVGPEHIRVAKLYGSGSQSGPTPSMTPSPSGSPSPSPSTTPSPSTSPSPSTTASPSATASVTPSAPVTTPPTPELPVTGGGPLVPTLLGLAGFLVVTGFALRRLSKARKAA